MRVLLLEIPVLLRGILEHAIGAHSNCELLRDTGRGLGVATQQPDVPPDVVILGLTAAEDATLVSALLAQWPRAQILTLLPAGEDAVMHELRLHRTELGQVSPAQIVATLCDAVHAGRGLAQE